MTPPPTSFRLGVVASVASSVLYTAANVQLRNAVGVDPYLIAAVKAVPTVAFLAPIIVFWWLTGRPAATSYKMVPRFAAVALLGQFVGNAAFSVCLEHIGLAIAVPVTLGVLIIGGAVFGRVILGEPVGVTKCLAIVLLLGAIAVLSLTGNPETTASITSDTGTSIWFGVMCAAASGAAYSLFGVVMRQSMHSGLSMPATMLISGTIGMVSLSLFSIWKLGIDEILSLSSSQWSVMTMAGIYNFMAFVALTASLRNLPVVAVNLVNASQVALAATAGVWFFGEPITSGLLMGIALTIGGLLVLTRK